MSDKRLFLIEKCWQKKPKDLRTKIRPGVRGIYALLKYSPGKGRTKAGYDVVYVGMARGQNAGIAGRLRSHAISKRKGNKWTHFSAFKVWDNIPQRFVEELEGILREIYRNDRAANSLNRQKGYARLQSVRERLNPSGRRRKKRRSS